MVAAGDGATVRFVGLPSWTAGGSMLGTIRLVRRIPTPRYHSPHLLSHRIPLLPPGHPEASLSGRLSPSNLCVRPSGQKLQYVYPLPPCRDQQEAMLPGSGGQRLGYRPDHLPMSRLFLAAMQDSHLRGRYLKKNIILPRLYPSLWCHSCRTWIPLYQASYLSHRSGEACRSWRPFSSRLILPTMLEATNQFCCSSRPA